MNKLIPLTLAALGLTAPASAQIASFQHIILVIQENRTPDNLFQGLCTTPNRLQHQAWARQYNIQTTGWLDKTSPTGKTNPHAVPFGLDYDIDPCSRRLRRHVRPEERRLRDGWGCKRGVHSSTLSHAQPNRHSVLSIIPRARCSHIWISPSPMVGQTICSRPTRGPASRRINSCSERHRLRRRTTTTTAFSQRITWQRRLLDAPRRVQPGWALIDPKGVTFTGFILALSTRRLLIFLNARRVSWRYYGVAGDIWVDTQANRHLDGAEHDRAYLRRVRSQMPRN